jgi:hypothetical protein
MKLLNHCKSGFAARNANLSLVFQLLRFFVVVITSGTTMYILAPAAQACECGSPSSVYQAAEKAKMVFRGKVLSMETITIFPEGYQFQHMIFTVKRFWKGPGGSQPGTRQSIFVRDFRCSYPFTKGKEYLVYATANDQGVMKCSRTKPWTSVGREELELLGQDNYRK